MVGLSKLDKTLANNELRKKLITSKADNTDYHDLIIQTISANGKLIFGIVGIHIERVRAILAKKISEITSAHSENKLSHPTTTLISIATTISETDFLSTFKPEFEALLEKRAHSGFLVNLIKDKPSLLPIYLSILLSKAGSSDFATANSFADSVEALDSPLGEILTDEQSLQLIVAIMQAAGWGAWSAKGVVSAKFAGVPTLRTKAVAYITANQIAANTLIKEKLSTTKSMSEFIEASLTDEAV